MLYNVSNQDLKYQSIKRQNQIDLLSSNTFLTSSGQVKTFLDVSMSANISSRYYAQLANKVNTLQQIMTNQGLVPIFMTITLDGVFHDLLYGDYSRFTLKHQKKLPENQKNGYLKTMASNREPFSVRDLYQLLRSQWASFQNSRVYRKMKKEGFKPGYLFSVEPHKSGVPHAHILLYVPEHFILPLRDKFKDIFDAKLNITQDKSKLTYDQIQNGELNGYQWTLSNAVAYVMKYCTKSFMDIKNNSELDKLQAWYMKYKIIRITMSHSLVPQWVYNKIYPLESDWLYLSTLNLYKMSCEWSYENDYFRFVDDNLNKEFKYERGLYQMYINNNLVEQFGEQKPKKIKNTYRVDPKPILRKKVKKPIIQLVINGKIFDFYKKPISKRSDYDLLTYYRKLDPNDETIDLKHFALVQNECIERGLIQGNIQSPNNFNLEIGA